MKYWSVILCSFGLTYIVCSCDSSISKADKVEEKVVNVVEDVIDEDIEAIDDFEEFIEDESDHCTVYSNLRNTRNLRDPNKLHIKTGKEVGLSEPFRKNADFLAVRDSILQSGKLIFVDDGVFFRKKTMKHSYPYLTPEAVHLLEEISTRFNEKLKQKNMPEYSLQLTSCLRTMESQSGLRRKNRNATRDTSSHVFGASFDISYWEFYRNSDGRVYQYKVLQNILSKTIKEIRNEKKCLVIKETGQFCFHCTVLR